MLAIPIDKQSATTISKLYGNAPYFALVDEDLSVIVIDNIECGNGPKIAPFLKSIDVTSTVFYHMGEGVYSGFVDNDIAVYTAQKKPYTLDELYSDMKHERLQKLDSDNYKTLLDSGATSSCQCGCN